MFSFESESDRTTNRLLSFLSSRSFLDDEHVDLDAFEFMSGRGGLSIYTSFKPARGHVEDSGATVSKTGKSDLGDRHTSGSNSST